MMENPYLHRLSVANFIRAARREISHHRFDIHSKWESFGVRDSAESYP
jgi:hypothetical protein